MPATQGQLTTPIVEAHVDSLMVATNEEIREAMRFLAFEQRLIVEPAAAAPVAALLAGKINVSQKKVVLVLTGANIDFPDFVRLIQA
jgi:threonine dehydratase